MIVSLFSHFFPPVDSHYSPRPLPTLLTQTTESVCVYVLEEGVYSLIPIIETRHMSFLWDYHPAVGSD